MLPRTARSLLRSSASSSLRLLPYQRQPSHQLLKLSQPAISRRRFHVSLQTRKGVLPDSSDPEPPKPEPHFVEHAIHINEPAPISGEEYHEIADEYIDELVMKLEEMIESGEQQYEVEYSAGVMTLNTPHGTYVLNKQPPNKQIWISSPVSGPKRYDWVTMKGEGQDQKEGTALDVEEDLRGGQWVYLRDGSTLTELLKKELDVDMSPSGEEGIV